MDFHLLSTFNRNKLISNLCLQFLDISQCLIMQANILHPSAFSDLFNVLPLNRYCIIHVLSRKVMWHLMLSFEVYLTFLPTSCLLMLDIRSLCWNAQIDHYVPFWCNNGYLWLGQGTQYPLPKLQHSSSMQRPREDLGLGGWLSYLSSSILDGPPKGQHWPSFAPLIVFSTHRGFRGYDITSQM